MHQRKHEAEAMANTSNLGMLFRVEFAQAVHKLGQAARRSLRQLNVGVIDGKEHGEIMDYLKHFSPFHGKLVEFAPEMIVILPIAVSEPTTSLIFYKKHN